MVTQIRLATDGAVHFFDEGEDGELTVAKCLVSAIGSQEELPWDTTEECLKRMCATCGKVMYAEATAS